VNLFILDRIRQFQPLVINFPPLVIKCRRLSLEAQRPRFPEAPELLRWGFSGGSHKFESLTYFALCWAACYRHDLLA
jgi:hypothetical protein